MATQHEKGTGRGNGKVVSLHRRTNLRPAIEIHWSEANAEKLRLAVDAVSRCGAAIMLGRTSDGGALSICILDGDSKIKEYPHTAEELAETLDAIAAEYVDL